MQTYLAPNGIQGSPVMFSLWILQSKKKCMDEKYILGICEKKNKDGRLHVRRPPYKK